MAAACKQRSLLFRLLKKKLSKFFAKQSGKAERFKLSSKQKKEKIMTITGIITHVGAPREFEVPSAQGGKKKMTAVEITLQSGNNTFVVDAYDNLVKYINDNGIRQNDAVVAELRFDIRSIKTKDGNSFSQQNVTLNAINLINEKAF